MIQVVSRSLVVWLKASAFEASYAATGGYLVGQQLNGNGFNAFAGRCAYGSRGRCDSRIGLLDADARNFWLVARSWGVM